MRRVYTTAEVAIKHEDYVALRKSGRVNLAIDNETATRVISAGAGPSKGGSSVAFHFYNWLAIGVFAISLYFSFAAAWWWFIPGFVAMRVIWSANKSGNATNLLDAAMYDEEFYERFRSAGIWRYEMDEQDAKKYAA